MTSIGGSAFYDCIGLTSITIGSGVTYIDGSAFANCPELTDVTCMAEKLRSSEGSGEGLYTDADAFGSCIDYATLHVPAEAIDSYGNTAPWSGFGQIVALTDEELTDIKHVRDDKQQGDIYSLSGHRVENPSKGLYIKNGKKVFIK